jgi:hypothetical protein
VGGHRLLVLRRKNGFHMATVIAAFIGAILGSIGAVVAQEIARRRREQRERREALVRRYLFPLQDAVEALWHRVYNVLYEGGTGAMTTPYLKTTTVYAIGRVLAAERVLTLEAVYPQLKVFYPDLADSLQDRNLPIALSPQKFQQYDRIALAEAMIERDESGLRPSTYLDFRDRYDESGPGKASWLWSAQDAVTGLSEDRARMKQLLALLGKIAHQTANATNIPTSIAEKEQKIAEQKPEKPETAAE